MVKIKLSLSFPAGNTQLGFKQIPTHVHIKCDMFPGQQDCVTKSPQELRKAPSCWSLAKVDACRQCALTGQNMLEEQSLKADLGGLKTECTTCWVKGQKSLVICTTARLTFLKQVRHQTAASSSFYMLLFTQNLLSTKTMLWSTTKSSSVFPNMKPTPAHYIMRIVSIPFADFHANM